MPLRHGVQYSSTTLKRCPMSVDECAARVIALISEKYPQPFDATAMVEEHCGRFKRGAHAGKLRGWAEIEVVTEGGWKRNGPGERNGGVVRPGTVLGIRIVDFNGHPYLEVSR